MGDIEAIKVKAVPVLLDAGIRRAGIFGSWARNEATEASDFDFLVEIPAGFGLFKFARLKYELEAALQKKVDLVEYGALKRLIAPFALNDHVAIL